MSFEQDVIDKISSNLEQIRNAIIRVGGRSILDEDLKLYTLQEILNIFARNGVDLNLSIVEAPVITLLKSMSNDMFERNFYLSIGYVDKALEIEKKINSIV